MGSQEGTAREFSVWMLTPWSLSSDSLEKLYAAFLAQNLHSGVLVFLWGGMLYEVVMTWPCRRIPSVLWHYRETSRATDLN